MENQLEQNAKEDLCKRVQKVCGRIPDGLGDILSVLTHPDVIDWTEEYVNSVYENRKLGILELIYGG